jgi:NAD(P)-dependent dehydrogenase (short-subunit alcohol dehydrogenase family)
MTARNPARRIGTTDDVANTVLFAMSSTFLTGQTLHIDGGEPLTYEEDRSDGTRNRLGHSDA